MSLYLLFSCALSLSLSLAFALSLSLSLSRCLSLFLAQRPLCFFGYRIYYVNIATSTPGLLSEDVSYLQHPYAPPPFNGPNGMRAKSRAEMWRVFHAASANRSHDGSEGDGVHRGGGEPGEGRLAALAARAPAQGEKNGRHGLSRGAESSARRPPLGC